MTDAVSLDVIYAKPIWASSTGQFKCASVTNTVSPSLDLHLEKSVTPSNFDGPSKLQNPLNLSQTDV
jgi:hypothetical protein